MPMPSDIMFDLIAEALDQCAVGGPSGAPPVSVSRPRVEVAGEGDWPSAFAVTELAVAAVGAAAAEVGALVGRDVTVDRRLASHWMVSSIEPSWTMPPVWDAIAGVYETNDGWIRLHTNAPHHRNAAVAVLRAGDRDLALDNKTAVASRVLSWSGSDLEAAVVDAGGCAAEFRSLDDWATHPAGAAVYSEPLVAWRAGSSSILRDSMGAPGRPLAGLRVLDLTRVLAGPVATRFLAGWGAEVLRIDPLDWNEDSLVPDVTLGKRCARVDLATFEGRTTLEGLIASCDVMVHGYRPGALDGLGFGRERREALRPGLIDISLDAYGWTGPWAGRRGFDSLVQMSAGIAHRGMVVGGTDQPTPLPVQALDHAAGYLVAAAAVRAVRHRLETGVGVGATLSLARTAKLLTDGPEGSFDAVLGPLSDDDFSPIAEVTSWGPARRLKAPCGLDGVDMEWNSVASPLGSSPARWSA